MRRFEEEFVGLNNILLDMGGMVAQSVHRSVLALVERNADYAAQVRRDEISVDEWICPRWGPLAAKAPPQTLSTVLVGKDCRIRARPELSTSTPACHKISASR